MQERPYAPPPPPPPPPPPGWQPQPGQPPHYGYAPQPPPAPHQTTNVFAVLSLISSILGILPLLPVVGSIVGIVLGIIGRNEIQNKPEQKGRDFATWGIVLGIVGIVLWALFFVVMAFMSALFGRHFGAPWWDYW